MQPKLHVWEGGQRSHCFKSALSIITQQVWHLHRESTTVLKLIGGKNWLSRANLFQHENLNLDAFTPPFQSSALASRTTAAPTWLSFIKKKVLAAQCHLLRTKVELTTLLLAERPPPVAGDDTEWWGGEDGGAAEVLRPGLLVSGMTDYGGQL